MRDFYFAMLRNIHHHPCAGLQIGDAVALFIERDGKLQSLAFEIQ